MNTRRFSIIAPALGALFLFTAASDGCGGGSTSPDPETERTLTKGLASSIALPGPLVPSTIAIPLTNPTFSRTFASGATVIFQHSLDGYQHGIVVVLEARPEVSQGKVVNLLTDCVAGAASMAGHVFDGGLTLGSTTSDLYACTGDAREPFSKTTKVKTCRAGTTCTSALQPGQDYWWFVLGYDDRMRLTHSSPAYLFRWKE